MRRIEATLAEVPEVRQDRIEHARMTADELPDALVLASRMIARLICDAVR